MWLFIISIFFFLLIPVYVHYNENDLHAVNMIKKLANTQFTKSAQCCNNKPDLVSWLRSGLFWKMYVFSILYHFNLSWLTLWHLGNSWAKQKPLKLNTKPKKAPNHLVPNLNSMGLPSKFTSKYYFLPD